MMGKRIAILGLGRSGLAVGRAALARGGYPLVLDEKSAEALPKPEIADEARQAGIPLMLGWSGALGDLAAHWSESDAGRGGPDLFVVNPAVPKTHPRIVEALALGVEVVSEVEFAYRISRAPIVAITGTNGKSTTTVMTYLALRACGEDAVLCGNIFGSGYPETPLTDAALNATPDQVLVAEVSSYGLDWTVDFQPVSAGITNIWPDHLDRYASFEEYAATKHRIFACMDGHDTAVVRANDPVVHAPGGSVTGYRSRRERRTIAAPTTPGEDLPLVLTFGATGKDAQVDESELRILHQRVPLSELPFDEPHNYQNACMAALLAYGLLRYKAACDSEGNAARLLREAEEAHRAANRVSVYAVRSASQEPLRVLPSAIIEGLKSFRGLAHRMEKLGERDGVRVVNNSMCTNPDAVIKSAMALRDPAHLLIGGVNKGLDFRPLRNYLAGQRHRTYLFGSDAGELNEMLGGDHPTFATMDEAFTAAVKHARPGEIIMLAPGCASTDQFRDFRDRGNVFKAIAKDWLRA